MTQPVLEMELEQISRPDLCHMLLNLQSLQAGYKVCCFTAIVLPALQVMNDEDSYAKWHAFLKSG